MTHKVYIILSHDHLVEAISRYLRDPPFGYELDIIKLSLWDLEKDTGNISVEIKGFLSNENKQLELL